jgi:hypothetical protein
MATNFKVTQEKSKSKEPVHYEYEREHVAEMRRIKALEQELKRHEKMPAEKAHGK